MPPRSISPASTADQNAEHQREEPDPDRAATPPLPPPQKDIYATLASTLAPMDAEQYYQSIQRDLPEDHATLQGWKQEKTNNNEWGTEEDLLWEDTWKGTKDALLEAAAATYPRPPGDTRHGLHALLAFHSWKHATPSPCTPSTTIHTDGHLKKTPPPPSQYSKAPRTRRNTTSPGTIRHPPASPALPDVFATISAELQEAKAPQQPEEEMPQAPSPPTTQENPRTEPLCTPSPQWSSSHSTAPPWTATGFGTCHGNGRFTTSHSDGTKSHRGSRPSASTR